MTTNQIHDAIQTAPTEPTQRNINNLLNIIEEMNNCIKQLEQDVVKAQRCATNAFAAIEQAVGPVDGPKNPMA